MGSSINSIRRRLGVPVSFKLHSSFTMPIVKELRSFLDLCGWVSTSPSINKGNRPEGLFVRKRNLHLYNTVESWVAFSGNHFIRMRVSDSSAVIGVHVYIFGGSSTGKNIGNFQFRSGCLSFFSKAEDSFLLDTLSTCFLEQSLEILYRNWFGRDQVFIVSLHNLFIFLLINYFDFIRELQSSLKLGYSGRLTSTQFIDGIIVIVAMLQLPYPTLLGNWLRGIIEYDKRVSVAISLIKEVLSCFDPFVCKLRGLSLVLKGRIAGAEKSVKQTVRWGQIPLETISGGIVSSIIPAYTLQGVIGIRVSLYFILFVFDLFAVGVNFRLFH
jgi:hypothetical protein